MSQPSDEGLIQRLKVAWRNERCSPELLPAEQVLVDKVMNLVEAQERQIEEQWEAENKEESVRIAMALQQLELDRIRFMLRSYLRARLNKVEKYTTYYLDNSKVDCLSDNERSFAIRYKEMIERHFEVSLLNEIPEKLRSLETVTTEINMVPKPDLTAHVFCLVQELSLIHISEPTRLLSISYAVFCLKKKKKQIINTNKK
eukprot:TRINITY_DN19802_c0_g1_i2.p1 TRINITY_DN19802_c0_g1~~TRINITY_DN19802_c0_g1_i2.p1  ORF type:complete len:201 (+),score=57.45 TRINITY_DN19802_c0_g1_i2:3-605(+)